MVEERMRSCECFWQWSVTGMASGHKNCTCYPVMNYVLSLHSSPMPTIPSTVCEGRYSFTEDVRCSGPTREQWCCQGLIGPRTRTCKLVLKDPWEQHCPSGPEQMEMESRLTQVHAERWPLNQCVCVCLYLFRWLGGSLVERRTSVSQIRGSIPGQVAAV